MELNNKLPIFSSFYLAPIEYYSQLFSYPKIVIEACENFQKQSFRNRMIINGANGTLSLTIPIEQSKSKFIRDIRISNHGNWRHIHWNAIISAYNSSPYFEYISDDLKLFYDKRYEFLFDFNEQLREWIFKVLDIQTEVSYSHEFHNEDYYEVDFREKIHPKRASAVNVKPYYRVFENEYDSSGKMSILDLIFNEGRESRIFLNNER